MTYPNEGPTIESPSTPPQSSGQELVRISGREEERSNSESFLDQFPADQPERELREQLQDGRVLTALKWILPVVFAMLIIFGLTVRATEELSFWQRLAITAGITTTGISIVLFLRHRRRIRRERRQTLRPSLESPTTTSAKITREAESYIASGRQHIGQILDPAAIMVINTSGVVYVYGQHNIGLEIVVISVCLVPLLLAAYTRFKSVGDFRWRYPLLLGAALVLLGIYAPQVTLRALSWVGDHLWIVVSYLFVDTFRVMLTVWTIGSIFAVLRIIEWWYGLIYVTPSKVILRRGVIFPRYPSMERRHMSDSEPKQGLLERIFGCWKLVLESTGQKQSLNKLYWVPRKMLPPMGFSEYGDPHIKL